ncbi:MAG: hypothetical protein ACRDRS_21145 [Pseudonocardiaceae bacterium]
MPEYRVSHVIDVVADNPSDAAEAARAARVRAGTLATVFEVAERLPGQRYGPRSRSTWTRATLTSSPRSRSWSASPAPTPLRAALTPAPRSARSTSAESAA